MEIEEEKISFGEIRNYLDSREKENKTKEKKVLELINERIKEFVVEIEKRIRTLEEIDVEAKKAKEELKSITISGRNKYIESVEEFVESLEDMEKENLEKFIQNAKKVFSNFEKSSRKNYERATVLIGKEMGEIKKFIGNFSLNLEKMLEENKEIIEFYENIAYIKEKLYLIDEKDYTNKKIEEEIKIIENKIEDIKKLKEKIVKEIERIKNSEEYKKNIETKEKIESLENDIDNSIVNLRQFIDFRKLANFFHIFENQMEIVKKYRENFKEEFKKDFGKSLIILLNEAKLNNEAIEEKINQIKNKKEALENLRSNLKEDKVEELSSELEKINLSKEELNKEKENKEKIKEELKKGKEIIKKEVKDKLKEMDVIVTDNSIISSN